MPGRLAATLAFGLPDDSRTKKRITGLKASPARVMMAAQLDTLNMLLWMQTKDAAKGRNRPTQILPNFFTEPPEEKREIMQFDSSSAFEAMRARLLKGSDNG